MTAARGTDGTASLQGSNLTVTLVNGVATFSGLSYNKAETMNIVFSTNAGAFTATSTDVVVSPAAASQLVVTTQPSTTATAGVDFATQPVVAEEDPFGNIITTDSTHTVTAARGTDGTASLQGSKLTVTLVNGVATFSGLSYNKAETMDIGFSTNAGCVHGDIHRCGGQPGGGQPVGGDHAAVDHGDGRRGLRHAAGGGGRRRVRQHHHHRQHAHGDGGPGH